MIWAFEVDTGARRLRALVLRARRWRASCCCGRSAAPSISCRPTSSTDDEIRALVARARSTILDARMTPHVLALACVAAAGACARARRTAARRSSRAFLDAGVPLDSVAVVVQEVGQRRPLFTHDADRPMNPASVMKLVTTFAALELLGPDYRWKTEAYLGGTLDGGVLRGDLVLKGYGDPKITIEQWQAFMATLRANGLERDRPATWCSTARTSAAASTIRRHSTASR